MTAADADSVRRPAPTVGPSELPVSTEPERNARNGRGACNERSAEGEAARPLRVMLIINAMGRGGAEIQVADVAIELKRRGHAVAMVVLLPFEEFEDKLVASGIETSSLGMRQSEASLVRAAQFASLVRRWKPDVVHAHQFAASMLARVVRPLTHVRALVCTSHSLFETSRSRYAAYRLTNRFSEAWTHVSREGIDIHRRNGAIPSGAVHYTPNGIVLERFGSRRRERRAAVRASLGLRDEFVWLTAGSFRNESKDYNTSIEAFRRVAHARPDMVLLIAGTGRLVEEKRAYAERMGIADRVRFLGLRTDLSDLMIAADGFVLTSAWESQGLVILEAAASELPIVTTDVGCARDVVVDSGVGRVVPTGRPDLVAHAMLEISGLDPGKRDDMGRAARAVVDEKFNLDGVVTRWEGIYRAALRGSASNAGNT